MWNHLDSPAPSTKERDPVEWIRWFRRSHGAFGVDKDGGKRRRKMAAKGMINPKTDSKIDRS